ncbi:MAG: hypothetical protein AAF602_25055, partial [Myxococcota bacterium]
ATSTGAWSVPSDEQCIDCHTAAAGVTLGLTTAQLASAMTYPSTGRTAQQLATLVAIDLFTNPPADPEAEPALPGRDDPSAPLDELARTFLDVNCASCHRPDSENQGRSRFDLRRTTGLGETGLCDVEPRIASFGIPDARLIAPGSPDRSIVIERMGRRDFNGMPPAATLLEDPRGLDVVSDWIASLPGCD